MTVGADARSVNMLGDVVMRRLECHCYCHDGGNQRQATGSWQRVSRADSTPQTERESVGAIAATVCGGRASGKSGNRSAIMQSRVVIGSARLADERGDHGKQAWTRAALLGTFL